MDRMKYPLLIIIINLLAPLKLQAETKLRLPNIFGQGMVIQRDKPVNIWGGQQRAPELRSISPSRTRQPQHPKTAPGT